MRVGKYNFDFSVTEKKNKEVSENLKASIHKSGMCGFVITLNEGSLDVLDGANKVDVGIDTTNKAIAIRSGGQRKVSRFKAGKSEKCYGNISVSKLKNNFKSKGTFECHVVRDYLIIDLKKPVKKVA